MRVPAVRPSRRDAENDSLLIREWRPLAVYVALAVGFDLAAWRIRGLLQGVLLVPATLVTAAAAWSLLIYGLFDWAAVAARHRVVGALGLGTVLGSGLWLAWWVMSGDVALASMAGLGGGAITTAAFLTARRQS